MSFEEKRRRWLEPAHMAKGTAAIEKGTSEDGSVDASIVAREMGITQAEANEYLAWRFGLLDDVE